MRAKLNQIPTLIPDMLQLVCKFSVTKATLGIALSVSLFVTLFHHSTLIITRVENSYGDHSESPGTKGDFYQF